MTYQPLTKEQYQKAISAGFTHEQIIQNELKRKQSIVSQEVKQPEKKTLLQKAGDFLGVSGLAKGITASILTKTDKEYNRILQKANKGETITAGERAYFESIAGEIPTNKEVIGSALQTAATIGTIGIGAGKFIPTAAKLGAAGTTAGFGAGLGENKSITDSLKQAFVAGITSVATYSALVGAGKIVKKVLDKVPTRIYASTAKLEKQSAQTMLDAKQVGSLGKLKGYTDAEGNRLNAIIQEKIKANNGTINSKDFIKNVVSKIQNEWQGVSKDKILKAIKNADVEPFLKNKTVDYLTADNIRQGLGNTIGNAWKTDNPKLNLSIRDTLWKEIVNTIRPATNTTQEFIQYAPLVKASKSFGKVLANQEKKFGFSLYDIIGGGIGYAGGGVPGIVVGAVGRRALESTTAKTATAVGLNELNKIINKIPTDTAGRISKTALINAFKNIGK